MTTKIFMIFVEGETDKTSLDLMLTTIAKNNNLRTHFIVFGTDITQKENINVSNILKELNSAIALGFANLKRKYKISLNDITKIYHIVDSDGVYIPDENVKYINKEHFKGESKIEYTDKEILTPTVNYIVKRNNRKASILNLLSSKKEITVSLNNNSVSIPYSIFYMSTNIEHVLHNIQNPSQTQKVDLADEWELNVADDINKINEFFDDKNSYVAKGTYIDSWNELKKDLNSLSRLTNFKLLINDILELTSDNNDE